MSFAVNETLANNARILKSKASRTSIQAFSVAVGAAVVATVLACYFEYREITFDGLVNVQQQNFMLWILDAFPFVFSYIGQYASYVLAQEASLLVLQQTEALRQHANQMEKQANFASTHDALTELPNRALFYDRLEQALRNVQTRQGTVAVFLLSVDNLKEIEDTFGLTHTDLLTKQIATRLSSWADKEDSVARYDNHSFAVLLTQCHDRDSIEASARNLIKAIEPHFVVNDLKLSLRPSIGIALYPDHGDDADSLLQRAGVAEHAAGQSVSGYTFYSPNMDERSPRRLTLMGELKRALERDELQLHYQPKVDLFRNKVIGVEALVRWQHHEHGHIPPDEFITLAEDNRMIRAITQWVLDNAFQASAHWREEGHEFVVSINLSTQDLHDPELPDLIAGIAAKTGVQPDWVAFEITESGIMAEPMRVMAIVERLRGMGYSFSIDDFGTGYSSLAYLKRLPVSELKIDKSFVMDMLESENDTVIVRAIVDLAHNLGLKVTAEGIMNAEALNRLKSYGCDIGQGYLFSKPLPASEFIAWLSAGEGLDSR